MDVIVNDASALIDIFKAGFLQEYSSLDWRLVLPDVVERELRSLSHLDLVGLGFEVVELDSEGVLAVKKLRDTHERLSVADSFALVVAESMPGSILLTGDRDLRRVAQARGVEVHGVLWLLDALFQGELLDAGGVLRAIAIFESDVTIRMPAQLLEDYRVRYSSMQ